MIIYIICEFKFAKIERPISEHKIMFLRFDIFQRLSDDRLIRVISSHEKQGFSKSYFYFLFDKLKALKMVKDNSIAFKIIIPFHSNDKIEFSKGLAYVFSDYIFYYINLESSKYSCNYCPIKGDCIAGMKQVAKENGVKISKDNPREAWNSVIEEIQEQIKNKIVNLVVSN